MQYKIDEILSNFHHDPYQNLATKLKYFLNKTFWSTLDRIQFNFDSSLTNFFDLNKYWIYLEK